MVKIPLYEQDSWVGKCVDWFGGHDSTAGLKTAPTTCPGSRVPRGSTLLFNSSGIWPRSSALEGNVSPSDQSRPGLEFTDSEFPLGMQPTQSEGHQRISIWHLDSYAPQLLPKCTSQVRVTAECSKNVTCWVALDTHWLLQLRFLTLSEGPGPLTASQGSSEQHLWYPLPPAVCWYITNREAQSLSRRPRSTHISMFYTCSGPSGVLCLVVQTCAISLWFYCPL